jgi:hypothetical protein
LFLPFLALSQVVFPAVRTTKPAVKEFKALVPWNLEADVDPALSPDNWLTTFCADDDSLEIHTSPLNISCSSRGCLAPGNPFSQKFSMADLTVDKI